MKSYRVITFSTETITADVQAHKVVNQYDVSFVNNGEESVTVNGLLLKPGMIINFGDTFTSIDLTVNITFANSGLAKRLDIVKESKAT